MSEVNIHNIFPTTILQTNIGVDTKIKKQLIDETYDLIFQSGIKNGSTTIDKYILNKDNYSSLSKKILDELTNLLFNVYTIDKGLTFFITNSWCIKHEKNDFAATHWHDNSIFSGVYYFQTPKNSGDIIFKRNLSSNSILSNTLSIPTKNNLDEYTVKIEEGTLLLFPSHLMHYTEINKSNSCRYSLSFNVFFKGSIGNDQNLNRLYI